MRRKGPQSFQVAQGLPSPATLPSWSFPGYTARPSEGKEVGSDFRGLCGWTKCDSRALIPRTSGQLQRAALFCGEERWKRMEEGAHLSQ